MARRIAGTQYETRERIAGNCPRPGGLLVVARIQTRSNSLTDENVAVGNASGGGNAIQIENHRRYNRHIADACIEGTHGTGDRGAWRTRHRERGPILRTGPEARARDPQRRVTLLNNRRLIAKSIIDRGGGAGRIGITVCICRAMLRHDYRSRGEDRTAAKDRAAM